MSASLAFIEYKDVRQEPGARRRWFQSPLGDLMVWYVGKGPEVSGLQFCHPEKLHERVFTWRPIGGWRQQVVDAGTRPPMMKASPILVDTLEVSLDDMRRRIRSALSGLEDNLSEIVVHSISGQDNSEQDDAR